MADRYWVGGSGTWDGTSTANWSATSGGAPGASAPTSADDVYFDANSGSGTVTVYSTAVSSTTLLNKSGLTLSLDSDVTLCTGGAFTLTGGALHLMSRTLTVRKFFSDATSSRIIDFGSGSGRIVTNNNETYGVALDFRTTTNLTIVGTPRVTIAGTVSAVYLQNNATQATAINYTFTTFTIISNTSACVAGDMNINNWFGTNTGTITVYGDFTAASGLSYFGVSYNDWIFYTAGVTRTVTCPYVLRGVTFDGTGTWNLGSALTVSNQIYLNGGTLTTNNYNVTCLGFISSNTNTRVLNMGSSRFTINVNSSSTPNGWDISTPTNMTLNAGTSTIYMNLSFNTSFNGGGRTYSTLSIDSNNILTITGSNTFAVLRRNILSTNSFTINFQAGSTTTVNDFQIKGTTSGPTNFPITLNSTVSGSIFTLSSPTDVVSVDYLNLKDSVATGAAKWYAGNNSIDSGNNTGWIFSAPPSAGFFMFF